MSVGDLVTTECYEIDFYGRMVCHIFKGTTIINLEMIKKGWGWLPSKQIWIRDPQSFLEEKIAKEKKIGAWVLNEQISPSQWRKDCWENGKCDGAEK